MLLIHDTLIRSPLNFFSKIGIFLAQWKNTWFVQFKWFVSESHLISAVKQSRKCIFCSFWFWHCIEWKKSIALEWTWSIKNSILLSECEQTNFPSNWLRETHFRISNELWIFMNVFRKRAQINEMINEDLKYIFKCNKCENSCKTRIVLMLLWRMCKLLPRATFAMLCMHFLLRANEKCC